jgi:hypothetical protein
MLAGIADMFAELDGYERYETALTDWGHRYAAQEASRAVDPWRKRRLAEATTRWRARNPDIVRAKKKAAWKRLKTERTEAHKAMNDRRRAYWREHKRRSRAQIKEAA